MFQVCRRSKHGSKNTTTPPPRLLSTPFAGTQATMTATTTILIFTKTWLTLGLTTSLVFGPFFFSLMLQILSFLHLPLLHLGPQTTRTSSCKPRKFPASALPHASPWLLPPPIATRKSAATATLLQLESPAFNDDDDDGATMRRRGHQPCAPSTTTMELPTHVVPCCTRPR
jgi:hypothetical protein